jgi:hypothetical protein
MRLDVLPDDAELLYNIPTGTVSVGGKEKPVEAPMQREKLMTLPDSAELMYNVPVAKADKDVPDVAEPIAKDPNSTSMEKSVQKDPSLMSGFIEEVGKDFEKRADEVEQSLKDYKAGKISYPELFVQGIGKGAVGMLVDLGGEAMVTGFKGLELLMPETSQAVKDTVKNGLEFISTTAVGKMGMEALQEGADAWNAFKEEHPQGAKTIESVVNIATVIAPPATRAMTPPKADPLKLVKKADELRATQLAKEMPKRKATALALIEPKLTETEAGERAMRSTQQGALKRNVYEPTAREQLIADEVAKLPISKDYSYQKNLDIIKGKSKELGSNLEVTLRQYKTPIDDITLRNSLDDAIDNMMSQKLTMAGDEATNKMLFRMSDKIEQLWKASDKTPNAVLKVRKDFDSWMESQGISFSTDVKVTNITEGAKGMRRALNDMLENAVPEGKVKETLKRQHLLLSATDNLALKAGQESANVIGRAWDRVTNLLPFKAETNRIVGAGLGISVGTAAATLVPGLVPIAIGGGTLYLLGKGVMKASTRRSVAVLLEQLEKARKVSKVPETKAQIAADITLLTNMLKDVTVIPDSEAPATGDEEKGSDMMTIVIDGTSNKQ